jgi:UDP:flavonoid glycosyltransferase YjiC (YdhE family)
VGLPFIPRPKLNRDKLAAALIELAHNDHLRAAASALGDKIRAEKGVDNAVRLIEKCPRNATSHLA